MPFRLKQAWRLRIGRWAVAGLAVLLAACQSLPPAPPPTVPPTAPPVMQPPLKMPTPPRLGLALGGGAARGFAHIGVIQVLEEAGIRPALVVGTSAGSLVAALYASGKTGAEMAALALTMDEGSITDWSFPSRGLIRGEALARYVRRHTGELNIEQMKLPLGIVATDLDSGVGVLFRRGDTGMEYVDGGLVAPVPVRYAREMGAELVLAVDISTPPDGAATGDLMKLLLQTFAIMGRSLSGHELSQADLVLRPSLVGVGSADFTARSRAIQAGREAMTAALPALKARIAAMTL
jgi:NTE family protein